MLSLEESVKLQEEQQQAVKVWHDAPQHIQDTH